MLTGFIIDQMLSPEEVERETNVRARIDYTPEANHQYCGEALVLQLKANTEMFAVAIRMNDDSPAQVTRITRYYMRAVHTAVEEAGR